MRTKKILSLILAIAMMATISVSAADYTKLYHIERFDYEDAASFISGYAFATSSTDEATGTKYGFNDGGSRTAINFLNVLKYTTSKNPVWSAYSSNGGGFSSKEANGTYGSMPKFVPATMGKGNKAIFFGDANGQYDATTNPKGSRAGTTEYNMVIKNPYTIKDASETLVVTYVISAYPKTVAKTLYNPIHIYGINDDATKGSQAALMYYTSPEGSTDAKFSAIPSLTATTGVDTTGVTVAEGEPAKITYGFTHDEADPTDGPDVKVYYVKADGTTRTFKRSDDIRALTGDNRTVIGMRFDNSWDQRFEYADIRLYSIKNAEGSFNAAFTAEEDVEINKLNHTIKISQPVEPTSFVKENIVVKTGDVVLTEGNDYILGDLEEVIDDVTGEYYNKIDIAFTEVLEASTTYTVELPGTITNELGTALAGYNVASFTTKTPDILLNSFDVVSGFASDAEAAADGFVASGALQGAKLNLTNTTDAAKNVAVIYAVYASNGQLKDVVYLNDSIAADSTEDFETGIKLSEAGAVKAFVWDGVNSVKPQTDATVKTIAAAE